MLRAMLTGSLLLVACGQPGEAARPMASLAAATPPATADVSLRTIDAAEIAKLRPGDRVRLDLGAPAGVIQARTLSTQRLDGGRVAWTGAVLVPGEPEGEASLIVSGPSVTGSVRAGLGKTYRIRPGPNGNLVEATDHATMRPD